jgi:cell division protein FtsZ
MGALTVGVVTKPFIFEGKKRSRQADEGIRSLEESVDSLICIPNQRLLQLAGENLSLVDTFKAADEVLLNAVQGISDLINNTGLINADFADVSTVMTNKGLSLMGTGSATGTDRALVAARQAISSPLLEDVSIEGATGIIINITGNGSLTTHETNQAVTLIMEAADEDAEIIFGTVIDDSMGEEIKVTVIATGLQTARKEMMAPATHMARTAAPAVEAYQAAPTRVETPAPVRTEAPRIETPRVEVPKMEAAPAPVREETPVMAKNTDYAVKSEITFDLEDTRTETAKPKINWAEKLQSAASKYESQKNFDTNTVAAPVAPKAPAVVERQEYSHFDNSEAPAGNVTAQAAQSRESRIKSIAEKLGFFNFDEDEFDTPSFMKKNERGHDSQI